MISNTKFFYPKLSNCIRVIVSDAIENAKSGHPGMPLGMADVMTVLVCDFLKFIPKDPKWFIRDRVVLSAGHGSMLLYAFYYLTGYVDFSIEDIKQFRKLHSKTPGHPEYGCYSAVETTTGPLGQGVANAVGMAIASKKYSQYLKMNNNLYKIYCIVGDGCLMEGISYESISLAGHLKLNNLVILFDDNQISIDGSTELTISEDHLAKFTAMGWNVLSVDGHDFDAIHDALNSVQKSDKPSLIAFRTVIAKGCITKSGSEISHGSPLGSEEIALLKSNLDMPSGAFQIPEDLLNSWRSIWKRNHSDYESWKKTYDNFSTAIKEYLSPFKIDIKHFESIIPHQETESTRTSSGRIVEKLMNISDKVICGSADLSISNSLKNSVTKAITKDDFSGNFIHYGVREHSMAGIMNGLALSGFLPIGGTFLVFTDYMRPSIRLSSMMNLQVIYVATHDSIALGEDGATHQPIEQLASLRAIPNLCVMRPTDFAETTECWHIALSNGNKPYILALSRQNLLQNRNFINKDQCSGKGGYVISLDDKNASCDIVICATGSEVQLALSVATLLRSEKLNVRVLSLPCIELFLSQDYEYINSLLSAKLRVGIEAACDFGWDRILTKNLFFGANHFGFSDKSEVLYKAFFLTKEYIFDKIINYIIKSKNLN